MITTPSRRIPQFCPAFQRSFTSSLYATERNPKIVPRTDLQFHKLVPTCENKNDLIEITNGWIGTAKERKNHSTDLKMKAIFDHVAEELDRIRYALRFRDIGCQGREVYLARNPSTKTIESIAWGREFNGTIDMDPQAIASNPDQIPDSLENLNQSALEGSDSFLLRMIVKFSSDRNLKKIRIPDSLEITDRGFKNIIFQSPNVDDKDIDHLMDDFGGIEAKKLDFKIHGKDASKMDFSKVYIKNLKE